jgi:hypothetical protein
MGIFILILLIVGMVLGVGQTQGNFDLALVLVGEGPLKGVK